MPCCNSTTGSVQPSLRPDEAEEAQRRRFASAHRHRRHPQQRRRTRKREDVYRFRRRSYLRSPEKGSLRSHYSKCLLREVLEPPVDSAAFFLIGPPSYFQLANSAGPLNWGCQLRGALVTMASPPFPVTGPIVLRAGQRPRIMGQGVMPAVLSTPMGFVCDWRR
jgi:hypothetical protein